MALVVAPILLVGGMLFVLRVVNNTGRDLQTLADKLREMQPPGSESDERPSG